MRGDLEYAVGRGIADGLARPHVCGPMFGDDRRAAGVAIAQDTVGPGDVADPGHQIVRKGRGGVGEIMPVPGDGHACQLPMARGGVLAGAYLARRAPGAGWFGVQPRGGRARSQAHRRPQPKRIEVGKVQRAGSPLFSTARRAGLGNMRQGVRPGIGHVTVEEAIRIRRTADADRIHHDQENTRHQPIPSRIRGGTSGITSPTWIAA